MRNLFACTRVLAGKHGRRHLPRSLQGLSTPDMQRSWGNMKDLSAKEKGELLHGAWRTSKPIQLVADKTDRDAGGFTAPVAFSSEEEAQKFIADEDADDAVEQRESTLTLARRFFVELAGAAGDEIDAARMPPEPQSDEERRCEMRDVQRQFFADFYIEQGLITEEERYAFVDALLRPSRAYFLVNTTLALARLTVRDQLEAHQRVGATPTTTSSSSSVFSATNLDPCLFAVPLVPTQSIGAPLYMPYTPATTLVGPPEGSTEAARNFIEAGNTADDTQGTETAIDTADVLSAMLQDDFDCAANHQGPAKAATEAATSASDVDLVAPAEAERPLHRPPSLDHTYWLQRQVASNALLNVDLLSHAISMLSVRLAASAAAKDPLHGVVGEDDSPSTSCEVILYQADTTVDAKVRRAATSTYHVEIAQYLYRATQDAEEAEGAATNPLRRVVIAVEDATFTPPSSATPHPRRRCGGHREPAPLTRALLVDGSEVPVVDRYPMMVYVAPNRRPSDTTARASLRGRVVVCAPATSQDGVRPRGWLSSADGDDDDCSNSMKRDGADPTSADASPARLFSVAPPNNFVERCQAANANFTRLQKCLYNAIRAVDGSGASYVIYATQSMNVMENEAVVCAVLQRWNAERAQSASTSAASKLPSLVTQTTHVKCVPLTFDEVESCAALNDAATVHGLRLLHQHGRRGFSTWVAIEGGGSAQEPDQYAHELRTAVAQASWRTDPMRQGSDGGYVVCLKVTSGDAIDRPPGVGASEVSGDVHPRPLRSPSPKCLAEVCWWTHSQSEVTSAVTPALLHLLEKLYTTQPTTHTRSTVLHAGVPVGHSPRSQLPAGRTDAKALKTTCRLSSAATHVDVLATLKSVLPVLSISVLALSELLVLARLSSRGLRKQLRFMQVSMRDPSTNNNMVERETAAFLAAVEDLIRTHDSGCAPSRSVPLRRFHVVVEADPASLVPDEASAQAASAGHTLHPAVAAEVQAAGVVAQLEYSHRVTRASPERTPETTSSPSLVQYDFTLQLHVPADMPEQAKHRAALAEGQVVLRDALLYVYRRTRAEFSSGVAPRLWRADLAASPAQTVTEVRLPRGDEVDVELTEEEYEAAAEMPERFQRPGASSAAPQTDLFAEASLGSTQPQREGGEDWLEDTNYREWRRRRSQKR